MKIGIITVSDSCAKGEREDKSGRVLCDMVANLGEVVDYRIVPDERTPLRLALLELIDKDEIDLILTTGGTGISPRDITPDITEEILDKKIPGFAELMRLKTFNNSPTSPLSRAIAGIRKRSLIINLPGSPRGAEECLSVLLPILPHAFDMVHGLSHG